MTICNTYKDFSALESGDKITLAQFNSIFASADSVTISADNVRGAETVSKTAVNVGSWVNNGTRFIEIIADVQTLNLDELIADCGTGDYGAELADYATGYVCDAIAGIADSNTSIYYSDIMAFIGENPFSLADVIDEGLYDPAQGYNLYEHGQAAEYMLIEQDIYAHLADCLKFHAYLYCKKSLLLTAIPEELNGLICDMAAAEDNNAQLDEIPAAIDAWIEENGGDNND